MEGIRLFRGRAPLRLGLAGGGTDVAPYCDIYGGALLNVTISRYALATIELLDDTFVEFISQDLGRVDTLPIAEAFPLNDGLILHRAVYNTVIKQFRDGRPTPMRIITHVDSPMGSGLGSSSALVVAMVEGMREALQLPLGEYDVAHLAFHIERRVAGFAGGRQDQFAATFGGVNFMEFYADDHVVVNPLRIHRRVWNELESSLLLCFTGISRASAQIIEDQSKAVSKEGSRSLEAMHELKADAIEMKNALLMGDLEKMAKILNRSWIAKKKTSQAITNSYLDEMYDSAMESGAMAGKISGAGGGGFMFFLVDPADKARVISTLVQKGGEVSGCHMVARGAESWTKMAGKL